MSITPKSWKIERVKTGYYIKCASGCILAHVIQFPDEAELAPQCQFNASAIGAVPQMIDALDPDVLDLIAEELSVDPRHESRISTLRELARKQRKALEKASRGVP